MSRRRNDLLIDVRTPMRDELLAGLRDLGLTQARAKRILEGYPDGRQLAVAGVGALMALGLSEKEAKRVRAAFRVSDACDRSCKARAEDAPMREPQRAAEIFRRAAGRQDREIFMVAFLDARQQVIDMMAVAVGSLADVAIHPRELFKEGIRRNAHSIILAHNHPSGDAKPSQADYELTRRMQEVGGLVGIPVLDHIVVTPDRHFSMAAHGHAFRTNPGRARNPAAMRRALTRHA